MTVAAIGVLLGAALASVPRGIVREIAKLLYYVPMAAFVLLLTFIPGLSRRGGMRAQIDSLVNEQKIQKQQARVEVEFAGTPVPEGVKGFEFQRTEENAPVAVTVISEPKLVSGG